MAPTSYPTYPTEIDCEPRRTTVTERLEDEKKHLERRLEELNAALDALHANPEVAETIDAISKLGHL